MVFQDLSHPHFKANSRNQNIAPVTDRFLALFFDFALFSPIFTLIFSPFFKKIEVRYYTSPESTEFLVLLFSVVFGLAMLTAVTQAVFLSYFGFTPGKYVFKIRVISLDNENGKIRLTQALLRSCLWVIEILMFAVPFIEVFSHKRRQVLHDRAASTLVTTLKKQNDFGPHPFESQFVRNFLFLLACMAFFWSAVITSELYKMALRGDFKKRELENQKYLCSDVSTFAKKDMSRVDLAIALYLTQEADEDCLLNEADFALWTDHTPQRAWAYLAKGIYYRFDKEKSGAYFQKTCSVENDSEACVLAQTFLNSDSDFEQQEQKSLTAKIIDIKDLNRLGFFEKAKSKIQELSQETLAFKSFVQIENTKALIALGKNEEAKGAYENTWQQMSLLQRQTFSAWFCLEELDRQCENRDYISCDHLKAEVKNNNYEDLSHESVVALVQESECKNKKDLNMLAFHYVLEADDALKRYVHAISSESNLSQQARLKTLSQIAFDKNMSANQFLRRRAMASLIEKAQSVDDLQNVARYMQTTQVHDWTWQKMTNKLQSTSYAQELYKHAQDRFPASQSIEQNKNELDEQ